MLKKDYELRIHKIKLIAKLNSSRKSIKSKIYFGVMKESYEVQIKRFKIV
jgi:hypothetical protein